MKKRYIIIPIVIFVLFVAVIDSIFPDMEGPDPDKLRPKVTQTVETTEEHKISSILEFTLTAGEKGEYGEYMTYNKGTDGELTRLVYNVPSGTYSVTNIGEYRAQINVYSDATHYTEEGWEEPVDGKAQLIEVGESVTVYVYNDYYVYIASPDKLKMELISENTPEAPVVVTTITAPIETTEVVTEAPSFQHQTAYLGDYILTLTGATVYTDSANQHFLIANYQFTNNSSESDSMAWTTINTAFQNGVELDKATALDLPDEVNYNSDGYFKEAKNGGTVNAQVAYFLEDTTNYVEIELTTFFDYSGNPPQIFTIHMS